MNRDARIGQTLALRLCVLAFVTRVVTLPGASAADQSPLIPVGVARIDITPNGPIRLAGYGNRRTEATGVAIRIWAKALAIGGNEQQPCVLITAELIRAPGALVEPLAERLEKKVGLERSQLAVCVTHTHTGPALASMLVDSYFGSNIPPTQQDRVRRYTKRLLDLLEQVALEALDHRKPSRLAWSEGQVGFAVNRRSIRNGKWIGMHPNRDGPVDHALPILTVTHADGKLRALFVNYACHCTTYGPAFNRIHGDWAGVAAQMMEAKHPGCVALVALGCGGDANPEPRGAHDGFEMVNGHGTAVADEVERLLSNRQMLPLKTTPTCPIQRINLPLDHVPNRAELQKRLKRLAEARNVLARIDAGENIRGMKMIMAFGAVHLQDVYGENPVDTLPVHGIRIGDVALVTQPCELYCQFGLDIKRRSPAPITAVVGLADGYSGYCPTIYGILGGGYSGQPIYWARLEPNAGYRIVESAGRMLNSLWRDDRDLQEGINQ